MSVKVLCGDCVEVMAGMEPDSFDVVVTDPPYHLTEIPLWKVPLGEKRTQQDRVARKGFMGKAWDGGDVAFRPETWAGVYRVLKPGAHLLAFGGTRTYHRLVCAIEDAGFEVRDAIMWIYGSGFPKSLDVSKAIDRRGGVDIGWFGPWLRQERERRGIAQKDLAKHFPSKTGGKTGCVANWELGFNLPTVEQFNLLCEILDLPFNRIEEAEREVIGENPNILRAHRSQNGTISFGGAGNVDITAPTTEAAKQWDGWGTALKPATEIICVARKPLSEATVAANVLKHGTGALNIDACRISTIEGDKGDWPITKRRHNDATWTVQPVLTNHAVGRWPANVCHDGSPEVMDTFAKAGEGRARGNITPTLRRQKSDGWGNIGIGPDGPIDSGDTGTAARFFFTAKAASWEREGGHPTVKPQALMEWLVQLVTPPGGRVLDLFCGTGSTLVAADFLGFDAVGIDQDAKTCVDAETKIKRLLARRMRGDDAKQEAPVPGQMNLF